MVRRRKASGGVKADADTQQPPSRKMDEYDSSDEEDLRNTIGNIPVTWYDDIPHFGYDKDGKAIAKAMNKDQVEAFLEKMDDPDYWKKVFDQQSGGYVSLSDEQVAKLEAITTQRYADVGYNPYQPFVDLFSSQTEIHPISNRPESKQAFIPSLDEKRRVGRMVHAIKMGWARPKKPPPEAPKAYDLWAEEDSASKTKSEQARIRMHFPAPKVALPGNAESYNPPQEYLFNASQHDEWLATEPEERRLNFVPQKFDSLRKVPAYERFFNERYERCLDLYLAPRQQRMKLNVDYKDLLPELPNPADLRPFPTTLAYYLRGHDGHVRSVSFEPTLGELLVSGGADGTLRVWSMTAGYCVKTIELSGAVNSVSMSPVAERTLVAAVVEPNKVMVLNTGCGDRLLNSNTQHYLKNLDIDADSNSSDGSDSKTKAAPMWSRNSKTQAITIQLPHNARRVVWHAKGDYFATFAPSKAPNAVYIHQLSTGKSMAPFAKSKGTITDVAFHPREPLLFVASKCHIRVYDLAKCVLKKKLMSGSRCVSNIETDAQGENLFVAGLDRTFSWLDLQLSTKPWKSVKHHTEAIRALTYHKRYPLLATASDDGSALVYYAKVSVDSFKENELFPVRRLKAHTQQKDGLCLLDTAFHPTQPWLVTAGADGLIALFTY